MGGPGRTVAAVPSPLPTRRSRLAPAAAAAGAALLAAGLAPLFMLGLAGSLAAGGSCAQRVPAGRISLLAPGAGARVGATEYGGPGDPGSGSVGSSGVDLDIHPDSYAELGGTTFQTATAMGGLAYETPLRITWGGHSLIAYKRDIGLGGGPIDGRARAIDLWWQLAGALRIPYEDGRWSGVVRVQRPPASGAGALLGATPGSAALDSTDEVAEGTGCGAPPTGPAPAPVTSGPHARLLPDGLAAAPASAPG